MLTGKNNLTTMMIISFDTGKDHPSNSQSPHCHITPWSPLLAYLHNLWHRQKPSIQQPISTLPPTPDIMHFLAYLHNLWHRQRPPIQQPIPTLPPTTPPPILQSISCLPPYPLIQAKALHPTANPNSTIPTANPTPNAVLPTPDIMLNFLPTSISFDTGKGHPSNSQSPHCCVHHQIEDCGTLWYNVSLGRVM